MLKLLYKTILVSVLSVSLLLLDFSYKGIMLNSARAESVKTDKIDDESIMATLTMIVVGTLAKRLYTYKPTTDIMLAAAGGSIFIAGEVLAYFKLKDAMKGMEAQITRDKNGNVNREQIASIERLKKSYEEAKKTANTKRTLQIAAAAAFAAAGVAAYTMSVTELTALGICTSGIGATLLGLKTLSAECTAEASSPEPIMASAGGACLKEISVCTPNVISYKAALMKYELHRQSTMPSAPGLSTSTSLGGALIAQQTSMLASCSIRALPSITFLENGCSKLVPLYWAGLSGGLGMLAGAISTKTDIIKDLPSIYKQQFLKQGISEHQIASIIEQNTPRPDSLLMKAVDLFFPQAKAGLFSTMGIASGLAVTYILTTSLTIGPAIDMLMLIPSKRAIAWGILAGLTAASTMSTNDIISQIDKNIEKLDNILNSLNSMADGTTGSQIKPFIQPDKEKFASKANKAPNAVKYEEIDLSNIVKGTLPCGTGPEGKKCKSFEESAKDLRSLQGLDAETKMQMDSILKAASGLSGTSRITSGTLDSASKLASQSNAIKSSMDKARNTLVKKLKESGSKANLDADTKKLSDQIEKAMNDGLKKSNTTASDMLANMSGGGGVSSASSDTAKKSTEEAVAPLAKSNAIAGDAIDMNAGSADTISPTMTNIDDGSNGKMSPEELAAYNETAKKAVGSIDDYDIKKDEISKDTDANLFELISNRYLQSGYPRLFRVKDPSAPEAVVPIKN